MNKFKIWAVGLLLFLPSVGFSLTLSNVETLVRQHVHDPSAAKYSASTVDSFINEGQREVVSATWCLEKSTTIALQAGVTYYSLPSDYLSTNLVIFKDTSNTTIKLIEVGKKPLYDNNADFENSSQGTPTQYFTRDDPSGGTAQQIGFLPIVVTGSTGTVTVYYTQQVTDLSGASDVPFNGQLNLYPYHYTLVLYAVWQIKMLEGKYDEATNYQTMLDREITVMQGRFAQKNDYSPSFKAAPR